MMSNQKDVVGLIAVLEGRQRSTLELHEKLGQTIEPIVKHAHKEGLIRPLLFVKDESQETPEILYSLMPKGRRFLAKVWDDVLASI